MDQKYSHAHDAVSFVDRLPLLIMITVSIGFFFFPMHLYNVVRSGVDPLIAKITRIVPLVAESSAVKLAVPGAGNTLSAVSPEPTATVPVGGGQL